MVAFVLLSVIFLVVVYFVIRKAVLHAILDADDARRERVHEEARREAVRAGKPYPGNLTS